MLRGVHTERSERAQHGNMIFRLGVLCVLCGSILIACAAPTAAPTPTPNFGTITEQLARGAPLYAQNCATANCHGTKGEGIRAGNSFSAFPLVGSEFQTRNPNAQIIFDVVRSGDEANLRAMSDQQMYDAIAFELNQNDRKLTVPLTAQNAAATSSGDGSVNAGTPYPPIPSATLVPIAAPRGLLHAENGYLALRVDQFAAASSIGNVQPPSGSVFVLIVFALQDQMSQPLAIGPKFMRLVDTNSRAYEPQSINLSAAIERFHSITIEPEHGTAAIAVFAAPSGTTFKQLVYDDQSGHALTLSFSK
jgi:mono/diheme cytochrome c family protein